MLELSIALFLHGNISSGTQGLNTMHESFTCSAETTTHPKSGLCCACSAWAWCSQTLVQFGREGLCLFFSFSGRSWACAVLMGVYYRGIQSKVEISVLLFSKSKPGHWLGGGKNPNLQPHPKLAVLKGVNSFLHKSFFLRAYGPNQPSLICLVASVGLVLYLSWVLVFSVFSLECWVVWRSVNWHFGLLFSEADLLPISECYRFHSWFNSSIFFFFFFPVY